MISRAAGYVAAYACSKVARSAPERRLYTAMMPSFEMVFEIGPVMDSAELRNASSRLIPCTFTKRR
jgi:hypothetical protein